MTFGLNITEEDCFIALVVVLTEWLGGGVDVIRAQDNRVPEPRCANFVLMTPILRQRLAMNISDYIDTDDEESRTETKKTAVTVQLDIHGPASADNAEALAIMMRTDLACDLFAAQDIPGSILYATDPRQMPFRNAEQQIESRWVMEVAMQVDIGLTIPQQFADQAALGVINVDVTYQPA